MLQLVWREQICHKVPDLQRGERVQEIEQSVSGIRLVADPTVNFRFRKYFNPLMRKISDSALSQFPKRDALINYVNVFPADVPDLRLATSAAVCSCNSLL